MTDLSPGEYVQQTDDGPIVLDRRDKDAWSFVNSADYANWLRNRAGIRSADAIRLKADARWHLDQSKFDTRQAHAELNEACRLTRAAIQAARQATNDIAAAARVPVQQMAAE